MKSIFMKIKSKNKFKKFQQKLFDKNIIISAIYKSFDNYTGENYFNNMKSITQLILAGLNEHLKTNFQFIKSYNDELIINVCLQAWIQEKNEHPQNFPVSRFIQCFPDFSLTKFFKVHKSERCGSLNPRPF